MATRLTCRCVPPRYVVPRSFQRLLDELVDNEQIAEILGLSGGAKAVNAYAAKYDDWPPAVRVSDSGRCPLRLRSHILQWRDLHPARHEDP